MSRRTLTLLLSTIAMAAPAGLSAQAWSERLNLDVHGSYARIGGDVEDSGIGIGAALSYTIGSTWGVFGNYDRSSMDGDSDDYSLRHFDLGVRIHPLQGALVPVGIVGWTWRSASYEDVVFFGEEGDVKVHGSGPTLGVGASYRIGGSLSIDALGLWTGGDMDRVSVRELTFEDEGVAIDASSLRLNIGATLTLFRRR